MLIFVLGLSLGTCFGVMIIGILRTTQHPQPWDEPVAVFGGNRQHGQQTMNTPV